MNSAHRGSKMAKDVAACWTMQHRRFSLISGPNHHQKENKMNWFTAAVKRFAFGRFHSNLSPFAVPNASNTERFYFCMCFLAASVSLSLSPFPTRWICAHRIFHVPFVCVFSSCSSFGYWIVSTIGSPRRSWRTITKEDERKFGRPIKKTESSFSTLLLFRFRLRIGFAFAIVRVME